MLQYNNTIESIIEALRAIASPLIGLELQWHLREDLQDYGPDRMVWILALHAIVEIAGSEHSRFSTMPLTAFAAEEPHERREAHRIAHEMADRYHVPLYAPSVEDHGGHGGSAWIRSIGVGAEVPYSIQWEAKWWTDEGAPCSDNGTLAISAVSGEDACMKCSRELLNRFRQRPLGYRCYMHGRSEHTCWSYHHESHVPIEEIREIAFQEAGYPSRIARALLAKAADVTALSLMVAFESSFGIRMEQLGPIARWRSGDVSDAELDAELATRIEDARPSWDGPRVLRTARREGRSVAGCIREKLQHGERRINIVVQLREAFDIRLSDAKDIVERCDRPFPFSYLSADMEIARQKDDAKIDGWIEEVITNARRPPR